MGFCMVVLLLCFLVIVMIVEIFQYFIDEFDIDKTQPLNIDLIKSVIILFVENKICSKFGKPLPPSVDFYSSKAVYIIMACLFFALLGYIIGIQQCKILKYPIQQNTFNENNSMSTYNYDNEPSTCSLCLNVFKPTKVLLPCKHVCICTDCWIRFYEESQHSCPICRKIIVEVMDVYPT